MDCLNLRLSSSTDPTKVYFYQNFEPIFFYARGNKTVAKWFGNHTQIIGTIRILFLVRLFFFTSKMDSCEVLVVIAFVNIIIYGGSGSEMG